MSLMDSMRVLGAMAQLSAPTLVEAARGTLTRAAIDERARWFGHRVVEILDIRLSAEGAEQVPDRAVVYLSNHQSHLDIPVLYATLPSPSIRMLAKKELFHEIDGRPGYYLGTQLRYRDRAVLQVLHYDNRADPTVSVEKLRNFAWDTKFDAAALRLETGRGWTVLLQWLDGSTVIEPNNFHLQWDFNSRSAMLARTFGRHMVAARYDSFEVEMGPKWSNPGNEDGHAWTAAYSFEPGNNWRFMLEWLRVRSDVKARPVYLGEAALATETKVEVSVRYAISVH